MPDLLVEVRTEEIPAGPLAAAVERWREDLAERLRVAGLEPAGSVTAAATPRRLALSVEGLPERTPDRREVRVGPPASVAFAPDGSPTAAARGFARAHGVAVEALEVRETEKGRYVCVETTVPGRAAEELLPDLLSASLRALPFPKRMRWGPRAVTFPRPIRGLLALLGDRVLPWRFADLEAGRETRGHPFLAPEPIRCERADWARYRDALAAAYVVVEPAARRKALEAALAAAAAAAGGRVADPELLEEVTFMVEFPGVLAGRFDERFLELPRPVVEAVLRTHQRFFPVLDADGKLLNAFLSVVDRPPEYHEAIRVGNERVVTARLRDAEFFLEEDRRQPLAARREALGQIVFLEGLGTVKDQLERLVPLARGMAMTLFGAETAARAERAAGLAKCDLTTAMVGEFPELEGIMGEVYARLLDREEEEVCQAIREHRLPRGAEDPLPATPAGTALALAERLDLLVGCFLKGLEPTGSRDPYGLRRAAHGVLRLLLEKSLPLDLPKWLERAAAGYRGLVPEAEHPEAALASLGRYLRERVRAHFEEKGFPPHLVAAVLATRWGNLVDVTERLAAVQALAADPRFSRLVEVVERTHNIAASLEDEVALEPERFVEPLERELHGVYAQVAPQLRARWAAREYVAGSWEYLEAFGDLLHRYFQTVYVNVPDPELRRNRKAQMRAIYRLYAEHVADLSRVPQALFAEEGR